MTESYNILTPLTQRKRETEGASGRVFKIIIIIIMRAKMYCYE